jgi:hypothetical protein
MRQFLLERGGRLGSSLRCVVSARGFGRSNIDSSNLSGKTNSECYFVGARASSESTRTIHSEDNCPLIEFVMMHDWVHFI